MPESDGGGMVKSGEGRGEIPGGGGSEGGLDEEERGYE